MCSELMSFWTRRGPSLLTVWPYCLPHSGVSTQQLLGRNKQVTEEAAGPPGHSSFGLLSSYMDTSTRHLKDKDVTLVNCELQDPLPRVVRDWRPSYLFRQPEPCGWVYLPLGRAIGGHVWLCSLLGYPRTRCTAPRHWILSLGSLWLQRELDCSEWVGQGPGESQLFTLQTHIKYDLPHHASDISSSLGLRGPQPYHSGTPGGTPESAHFPCLPAHRQGAGANSSPHP